ncbi:MAG: hypothetical protein H2212_03380 [Ruminococcus sp.]|nr:hypothetical protein [Ruminococcus sp.]
MEVHKETLEQQDIIVKQESERWEGNLKGYKIGGIWALFGRKPESNDTWFCLQVGQTKNISVEISADIKYLDIKTNQVKKKCYVNQFGKEIFHYDEYPSYQELLYKKIRAEYENLIFICIYKEEDIEKRRDIEKYFAWNAYPLYWRNGGSYREKKEYSEDELAQIKNGFLSDIKLNDDIRKTIDSFLKDSLNK